MAMPTQEDRRRVEKVALETVITAERALGRQPRDVSLDKLGYDIESQDPKSGRLYFIEVKGREENAPTVTVTRNEIMTSLNKPDEFRLAIVIVAASGARPPRYVGHPFRHEPDFDAVSTDFSLPKLLARSGDPF
jgi:hypothetical protein